MKPTVSLIASALGALLLAPALAGAQQPPPAPSRFEAWLGVSRATVDVASEIPISYAPVIDSYSSETAGSVASQVVRFEGSSAKGLSGGLNYFFGQHLGVQVLFDRDESDLSGENGDFSVLLNYTARQPPDYVSRPYTYSRTDTACDASNVGGCVGPTTGELRQTTLGFDLVGRWPLGRHVTAAVSAGLSYHHLSGEAQPLRYTSFRMGGHSTLFSQDYEVAYSLEPDSTFGVNVGGSLDIALGRLLAIVIDARRFAAPEVSSAVTVERLVNEDEVVFEKSLGALQAGLNPPDVKINLGRTRLMVGLKIRL